MEGFKDFLKSLIKVIIPCVIIALAVFLINKFQPEEVPEPEIDLFSSIAEVEEYVIENSKLKLVMDAETSHFKVELKDSGKVWYSNPEGSDDDSIALPAEKNNMQSTLLLTYGTINGVWTLYNNYSQSIKNHMFEIVPGTDSIRVNYTIGNVRKVYYIPVAVPESRFNELIDKMDKKAQKTVKEYYQKKDINKKLRGGDTKEGLIAKYPDIVNEPVYVLLDSTSEFLKVKIEKLFAEIGYTEEDYIADLSRYEQVTSQDTPLFNIPVIYTLTDNDLIVNIPMDEIEYKSKYPIVSLDVLPYFGAGSSNDEGYMVIPESGGSIIKFNNGKYDQANYVSNIYGWDYAKSRKAVVYETKNAFPAFAICNNGSSFLCIADSAASRASVKADVSGRNNEFNNSFYEYIILNYEQYALSNKSNSAFYVYEAELPKTCVNQVYRFCDTTDYVKLAHEYRDYLTEKYPLLKEGTSSEVPTAVSVLQAVDKVQQIFGVPVSAAYELTTYDETAALVQTLYDNGFKNINLKLLGWMNGGITHDILNKVKLISDLGGKKAFERMKNTLDNLGVSTYLDADFEFAHDADIFDGFLSFRDAARFTTRETVELYDYSIVWYGQIKERDSFYLLKPQNSKKCFDTLLKYAKDKNMGISLRNIGTMINGDYNPKNLHTREDVLNMHRELLKSAKDSGTKVMINYGNDYALEYADIVTNMDITNSNSAILDYDIPFYQIAIHGLVDYTGCPINLSEDYELELLKSAEYGAGISFLFMDSGAESLQDTLYTEYFGASFDLWKDQAVDIYNRYKNSFDGLNSLKIVGHELITDDLRCTTYENGTKVLVNYGFNAADYNGFIVPARDYMVIGGEVR